MGLEIWNNGESGARIRKNIETNFKYVSRYLPNNILSLSTTERKTLASDYLSEGLIVFDTSQEKWYQYKDEKWEEYNFSAKGGAETYSKTFSQTTWNNGSIVIPYTKHSILEPIVEVYVYANGTYQPVVGGVSVDMFSNVTLSADMAFAGKVVIK